MDFETAISFAFIRTAKRSGREDNLWLEIKCRYMRRLELPSCQFEK
jgi:hypothetical protein